MKNIVKLAAPLLLALSVTAFADDQPMQPAGSAPAASQPAPKGMKQKRAAKKANKKAKKAAKKSATAPAAGGMATPAPAP